MLQYWKILGIEETTDQRAIKLAYAEKIKSVHPEDDPEGFKNLQEAYRTVLRHAKEKAASEQVATIDRSLYDQAKLFSGLSTPLETEVITEESLETSAPFKTVLDFSTIGSADSSNEIAEEVSDEVGSAANNFDFSAFEASQAVIGELEQVETSFSDFSEQMAGLDQVDQLVATVLAQLGLVNRFEQCVEVLRSQEELRGAVSSYFWSKISDHMLNMYLFGSWEARQVLADLLSDQECQTATVYVKAVGLMGNSSDVGRDTQLEGWTGV